MQADLHYPFEMLKCWCIIHLLDLIFRLSDVKPFGSVLSHPGCQSTFNLQTGEFSGNSTTLACDDSVT